MILYDMHTHSRFSFDSSMEMEGAADRALALGLAGIAFTDHLDVNYNSDGSDVYYDFGDYLSRFEEVRNKYAGQLDIVSAVEVGLQPHVVEENIRRLAGYKFDYKIGSTHLVSRYDPYDRTYFQIEPEKHSAYRRYLREMIRNIELYHDYNSVGHFDYLIRYADYEDNAMYYREFQDEFDALLELMIKYGLAFEVNTRSYDKTPMDAEVLRQYKARGGDTVVLGSDAHRYERIGKRFDFFKNVIKECGFDYIAHYRNMQPIYEKID